MSTDKKDYKKIATFDELGSYGVDDKLVAQFGNTTGSGVIWTTGGSSGTSYIPYTITVPAPTSAPANGWQFVPIQQNPYVPPHIKTQGKHFDTTQYYYEGDREYIERLMEVSSYLKEALEEAEARLSPMERAYLKTLRHRAKNKLEKGLAK